MSRLTAPLLSFKGSGQIAKTQVYASWKGIPYVRQYVIPANPRSTAQVSNRASWAWLSNVWKFIDGDVQAAWNAFASGAPLSGRNAFIGQNQKKLQGQTTLADFLASPGNGGGIPLATFTTTGSAGSIASTVALPTLPTGWSVTKVIGVAILDGDPHETGPALGYTSYTEESSATPWEPAWSSLTAGTYRTFGFPVIQVSSTKTVYGPSVSSSATVS